MGKKGQYQKSPEERKKALEALEAMLETGVKDIFETEGFKNYLKFMSQNREYSLTNTLLIYLQMPEATIVGGYNKFKNEWGHQVVNGSKGIKIYAPNIISIPYERLMPEIYKSISKEGEYSCGTLLVRQEGSLYSVYRRGYDFSKVVLTNKGREELEAFIRDKVCGKWISSFRVATIFDVSQTKPITITDDSGGVSLHPKAQKFIEANSYEVAKSIEYDNDEHVEAVYSAIAKCVDIPIRICDTGTANGYFHHGKGKSAYIELSDKLTPVHRAKTLLHEEAHHRLHNAFYNTPESAIADLDLGSTRKATRQEKEVQAEAVAYVVMSYLGIDTSEYSFGYIAGWSKDRELEELNNSLEIISKTANQFINEIEGHLEKEISFAAIPDTIKQAV